MVYSNITIRPPELIFRDPRWSAVTWDPAERDAYYKLAREAIATKTQCSRADAYAAEAAKCQAETKRMADRLAATRELVASVAQTMKADAASVEKAAEALR